VNVSADWRKPLTVIALVAAGALLPWVVAGPVAGLAVATVVLAVMLTRHLHNLSQLAAWLRDPRTETVPAGSGTWEQVFSQLLRLVRRQAQTEARLQEALTRFQKAGEALPEAVVILGPENRIDWCNPKAEVFFGIRPRDRGQQITYLLRHPLFMDYIQRSDLSQPVNLRLTTAPGVEVTLSLQIVPYGDSEKLLVARDVTRWERLETTRRDFVANVSHELRTPLTVLTGFLETLSDMEEHDPEMMKRSLHLMTQQTRRMHHLVEDLLRLSRLESTSSPLHEEDIDVGDLLEHLHQDALALSGGRHEIHLELDSRAGLHASADEVRSAFGNLVSNAVRYTPAGGRITLRWHGRGQEAVFSVVDTGIGIEAHHIDRLTERFYRVDRSRSRETGGTGLGLAIVKHVLSRHGAHLEVASEPGRGSTFAAVFPPERVIADLGARRATA
jgi:two-component system phosphate regulon sensor histidine kinase PhoR